MIKSRRMRERYKKCLLGRQKESDHSEDPDVDGRITLKWIKGK
jgi:hypothetical protein